VCLVAGVALAVLYLAQGLTLPPNHSDGGLLLDYVHAISQGTRPFWDFIDLYGPLCWTVPVLAYRLGGQQVWAIGVAVLLTKLLSIVLAYLLVARLAGRLPAVLAAILLTVLLGAPWQLLQTPYAMHPTLALTLAVWLLLLAPPGTDATSAGHGPTSVRVAAAGALAGCALWVKLNAGAFLLAGGLFYCFYWLPRVREQRGPEAPAWWRAAAYAGVVAYGIVFLSFVGEGWRDLFFFYLVAPLLAVLVFTLATLWSRPPSRGAALRGLRAWGVFLAAAVAVGFGFFLAYFGLEGGRVYVREIAAILVRLDYEAPFPPLGEPGQYFGFNDHYWPQLPWLVALCFLATVGVAHFQARRHAGSREAPQHVVVGLFALFTFQSFVIYSRADESHLVQAVWPAVPVLFVMVGQLGNLFGRSRGTVLGLGVGLLAAAYPLVSIRPESYPSGTGDWHSPRLRRLSFHPDEADRPRLGRFSPHISNRDWDVASNEAARHLDRLTPDGTEVLVTVRNELIHLNSNTRAVGGRHRYLFYLLKQGLISGEEFWDLVPDEVIRSLMRDPPPVIVHGFGRTREVLDALPELDERLRREYELVASYAHILIFERKPAPGTPPKLASQVRAR